MAVTIIVVKTCKNSKQQQAKTKVTTNDNRKDPASNPTNRDKGFDRRTSYLEYSNMQSAVCNAGKFLSQKWKT